MVFVLVVGLALSWSGFALAQDDGGMAEMSVTQAI